MRHVSVAHVCIGYERTTSALSIIIWVTAQSSNMDTSGKAPSSWVCWPMQSMCGRTDQASDPHPHQTPKLQISAFSLGAYSVGMPSLSPRGESNPIESLESPCGEVSKGFEVEISAVPERGRSKRSRSKRRQTQKHANARKRAQTRVHKRTPKKKAFLRKKWQTTRFETTRFGNSRKSCSCSMILICIFTKCFRNLAICLN